MRPRRHDPGGRRVDPPQPRTIGGRLPNHRREKSPADRPRAWRTLPVAGCRWAAGESDGGVGAIFLWIPPPRQARAPWLCQNCCDRAVIKMGGPVARAATTRLDGAQRRSDRQPKQVSPAPPPLQGGGGTTPPPRWFHFDACQCAILGRPPSPPPAAARGRAPRDPTAAGPALAATMHGTLTRAIRNSVVPRHLDRDGALRSGRNCGWRFRERTGASSSRARLADQHAHEISSQRTNRGHTPEEEGTVEEWLGIRRMAVVDSDQGFCSSRTARPLQRGDDEGGGLRKEWHESVDEPCQF